MENERKWRWADVGRWIVRALGAIKRGDFMNTMNLGQYFIHIIWTFFLFFMSIWLSLQVEKTLTKVEAGKKELANVEIYHAQKVVELAGLNRMTTVRDLLEEKGSKVGLPEKPAARIQKKTLLSGNKSEHRKDQQTAKEPEATAQNEESVKE